MLGVVCINLTFIYPYMHAGSVTVPPSGGRGKKGVLGVVCINLTFIYPCMHAGPVNTDPSGIVTSSGDRGKKGVLGMVCINVYLSLHACRVCDCSSQW